MRTKACAESDVREHRGVRVTVDGREIALFRRGSEIFALSNVCAHQHFSVIDKGALEGMTVACPMHGWTYDLRTGRATTGEGAIGCFTVSVEGGSVFIELPDFP